MRILVIDDDPAIRELLRCFIEKAGYQVFEAENGKEAEEIQRRTPADMVICDLIMPVREGIETISAFRKNFPGTGIIAISGGGTISPDSYLQVARQLGAWKIYSKPLDFPGLLKSLEEWKMEKGIT